MDHVVGVSGDPPLGFPGNVGDEGLHGAAVLEGGDEDEARFAVGEQVFEFLAALAIHRPGAGVGFDEQKPVPGGEPKLGLGALVGGGGA